MYDLVIKNGRIVTSDKIFEGTIAVKDEKIVKISEAKEDWDANNIIDAENNFVMPGAIDTHVHLNDPGFEWREDFSHGTAGAILGGYTTIIDMPLQNEPALTNAELFDIKYDKVKPQAYSDFAFWGGLVPSNFDDLEGLDKRGVVAFKSFLGPVSPDYSPLSYGEAYNAMEIIKEFDGRAGYHCEDYSIIKNREKHMLEEGRTDWRGFLDSRPESAELIATYAIIEIAKELNCKAHICHVSSPKVAKIIKEAQDEGYDITAETCAHYLTFSEEDLIENGALFKCAPPLRNKSDVDKMWEYVEQGVFSGIATDHSPATYDEKFVEILGNKINNSFDAWGGISGIQSGVQAAFSEGVNKRGVSPMTLVESMSVKPAKAFGIYGQKGDLKVGFDADIIIVDPDKEWEIKSEDLAYINKISAYVGLKGKGKAVSTILRGKIMVENEKIVGRQGFGELVKKIK